MSDTKIAQERQSRAQAAFRRLEAQLLRFDKVAFHLTRASGIKVYAADVHNVIEDKRRVPDRVWNALVKAGEVSEEGIPAYPYFKIRRDDPMLAALSIRRNLGRKYATELGDILTGLAESDVARPFDA